MRIPWNKGMIGYNKGHPGYMLGKKQAEETRKKMSKNSPKIWLGKHLPLETRKKIRESLLGYKHTEESRKNNSLAKKGKKPNNFGTKQSEETKIKRGLYRKGKDHWNWNGGFDRGKHTWFNPDYVNWRNVIIKRDFNKCRIQNTDCKGRLEVHHILDWQNYPELRFDVNNGIALCHFHHPRGRKKEKQLVSYFTELVLASKDQNF